MPIWDERAVGIPGVKIEPLAFAERGGDIHLVAAIDGKHAPLAPRQGAEGCRDHQKCSLRKPIAAAARWLRLALLARARAYGGRAHKGAFATIVFSFSQQGSYRPMVGH